MIVTKFVIIKGKKVSIDDLKPNSRAKIIVICPICLKERETNYRAVLKNNHCMCQSCILKSKSKHLVLGSKYGKWEVISNGVASGFSICKCECSKIKEINNNSLKNGKSKSCGCDKLYLEKRAFVVNIGDKNNKLTVIDILDSKTCKCVCECGNEKILKIIYFINGITKSCGCLRKEVSSRNIKILSQNQKGINHPNWKGGISSERSNFMQTEDYKKFRNSVFERDNYSCKACAKIGKNINAHHILSYSENIKDRINIENGITLCVECHRLFHKIYGRKNIGVLEIEDFIKNLKENKI